MGLFSKKPKPSAPDTPAKPVPAAEPAKSPKPAKGKRGAVDPNEITVLRSGLLDLKARLEASEQSRAIVEARLAALDATTTAMATEQPRDLSGDDIRSQLAELQSQLATVAETAATANANAENASAKAAAAATVASNVAATPAGAVDPLLVARLDQLAAQVAAMPTTPGAQAPSGPDPELVARLDQLAARVEGAPDPRRLAALEEQLSDLARKNERPVAEPDLPNADTLAQIERLAERVSTFDNFGAQLAQLNARVTAQAEFGAQLSNLSERISEVSSAADDRRAAAVAATDDADLRDRVNAIADRIALNEGLAAQIAQLAERVAANDTSARQATEQVAVIEQRLNAVSTELANQVSELGRDIDGLAGQGSQVAQGTVSDEVIDALKQSQVKLAAEQARYEIAFRQDLAALAEQVRRTPQG